MFLLLLSDYCLAMRTQPGEYSERNAETFQTSQELVNSQACGRAPPRSTGLPRHPTADCRSMTQPRKEDPLSQYVIWWIITNDGLKPLYKTNVWNYPLEAILPLEIDIKGTHTFSKRDYNISFPVANNATDEHRVTFMY